MRNKGSVWANTLPKITESDITMSDTVTVSGPQVLKLVGEKRSYPGCPRKYWRRCLLGRKAGRATRVPPPAQRPGRVRPGEVPHFRALRDPKPGRGCTGRTDNESKGVKTGQDAGLTSFGLSPLSGTGETHRKFSRFGAGRERQGKRPGRTLGLWKNGPCLQVPPYQILPFATFSYTLKLLSRG